MPPLVSVVVTTFNQAAYIEQALESALAQSYRSIEVIVVDDGSTDETRDVIRRFGDRVIPIFEANQGVAASRNVGSQQARGELLAFLDGDDVWRPEKLAVQVDAAERNPRSGLIVVDGVEFDESAVIKPSLFFGELADALAKTQEPVVTGRFYRELLRGSFIGTTSQVMIPAWVLADVGLSDTRLRAASDYDLYLRVAARYDLTFVKQPLAQYRYLHTSASGPRWLRFRWGEEEVMVLDKQAREGPVEERPFIRRELKWRVFRTAQKAYFHGRRRDRSWARRYLFTYVLRHPGSLHAALYLLALCCPPGLMRIAGPVGRALFPHRKRDAMR